jgi:ankyrin repeat protein
MSILEKATLKARSRKFGRLLNDYMLGEDSDASKNRQKVIDFLKDDKAMAGLDVNAGTTDIASANSWLPLYKNDIEMTRLMISRGASLDGVYIAPLEDYNGRTMRWALFSMATDVGIFQLLIEGSEPINTPVEDSGKTVLPLQVLLRRYKNAKAEKEKYLETIKYLLQNGADVNLNASSEPSVVMTIVQLDLPEIYELIPAGAIDKERKYLVEGHLLMLSCYEFLLKSKEIIKSENYIIHERNLGT